MKNLKKIAALALTASMMFSMAGCAMGGKLSSKKLIASAKDYGCEEIKDADDFAEMIDEGEDLEDGAYITVDGKDAKDIFKANDIIDGLYDSSIKSTTFVVIADEELNNAAFLVCMTFANKKDAQDYYDDQVEDVEDIEDSGYDVELDDGEEKGVTYTCVNGDTGLFLVSEGLYVSGSNVYAIVGFGYGGSDDYEDFIEDIGGCYDVMLPTEL